MKLALIRRRFAATGGAELYLQRLIRTLTARGHEVHLYAEEWSEPPEAMTVHRIPAARWRAARPVHFARAVRVRLAAGTYDCVFRGCCESQSVKW